MIQRSAADGSCRVFTFKEGVLSALAHDLELDVARFRVEWDEKHTRVEARFEADSLRVRWAVQNGRPAPSALSPGDKLKIEASLKEDVLHVRRFPTIHFVSEAIERDGDRWRVDGMLDLHGVKKALSVQISKVEDRLECEVVIDQPQFGITPFRAALGALKVKPQVRVRLSLRSE